MTTKLPDWESACKAESKRAAKFQRKYIDHDTALFKIIMQAETLGEAKDIARKAREGKK